MKEDQPDMNQTPLFGLHVSDGARMAPFAGWHMPLQYAGILAETRMVRSNVGMFDVSHMGRVKITGTDSPKFLDHIITAKVEGMVAGRARYGLICNTVGGIIDDVILYRLAELEFLLVPNAGNAETVLSWINKWKKTWKASVEFKVITNDTASIAVQGPNAEATLAPISSVTLSNVRPFRCVQGHIDGMASLICRTGYTGEDGFEIVVDSTDAATMWTTLKDVGCPPCGLGSRDVLRLEAGLLLHGSDIDASITPLEAGLQRFVSWDSGNFLGYEALIDAKSRGISRTLVGFRLLSKGVPRSGYSILYNGGPIGTVTSGTYSPSIDTGIGFGYVSTGSLSTGSRFAIDIRGREVAAEVVDLPFYTSRR